jgi:hypothetical protein
MAEDDLEELEEVQEEQMGGDVYNEEALDEEMDDDEINPEEEGFMRGYDRESVLRCDQCGNELGDAFSSLEVEGHLYRFCSKKCKQDFQDQMM